tara:strand:- start:2150 stop:2575 length:426 start_codon:yes stop_codon:yes gene_type:complete
MANIQLKRGQKTTVDVTYILSGQTNSFDFTAQTWYTAKLYIRRKSGDSYGGILLDTLTTYQQASATQATTASGNQRIVFVDPGNTATKNIQLKWSTSESTALPNEDVTVYGDLKIFGENSDYTQCIHSIRLTFDIVQEITS